MRVDRHQDLKHREWYRYGRRFEPELVMPYSAAESEAANEAASRLLNDIGLGACHFALEPMINSWLVHLECPGRGRTVTSSLSVEHHRLYASLDDMATYEHLRHEWSSALAECL